MRLKDDAYIHANYVATAKSEKQFICTQAPLDNTVETFWRMVVEERSKAIVMLCDFSEDGQRKCPNYYPTKPDQTLTYGDITIRCAPVESPAAPRAFTSGFRKNRSCSARRRRRSPPRSSS